MNSILVKVKVGFVAALLLLGGSALAQVPAVQWDARFGGTDLDYLTSLRLTPDGGYLAGGQSASGQSGDKTQPSQGNSDYWVVKMNNTGAKQWDVRFGGDGYEVLTCAEPTTDGGYLLGGYATSGISGDKTQTNRGIADYWVIKISNTGVKQWDARFGGNQADQLTTVKQTADGGFILGGRSFSDMAGDKSQPSRGNSDYWVVKIGSTGAKQWDARFGGLNNDVLTALELTADGGYLLGGYSASGITGDKSQLSQGSTDFWVVKISSTGAKLWDARYGGTDTEELIALQQTTDGGFILGGHSASAATGNKSQASQGGFDYWIVKVDVSGAQQWDARFGGTGTDQLTSLKPTTDGGFLLGGRSDSGISGDKTEASQGGFDYWTLKINGSGSKQWDARFGGQGTDELYALHQTPDGNYVLGGRSDSGISGDKTQSSQGGFDFWVLKLTQNTILTGAISPGNFSQGDALSVPYTASGNFNPANVFTAQLSDEAGNFTTPVAIGSVTTSASGLIAAEIPLNTPAGTGYRIRVVASSPSIATTADNDSDIIIGSLNGPYTVNPDGTGDFTSLTEMADDLNRLGVTGPVTIQVIPTAEPYTEPIELRTIPGASATNTVALYGNGATIELCSKSASANVNIISLNGTDHIRIDGFKLEAGCQYATGVRLMNSTDNVIISNNIIELPEYTSVSNKGIYITDAGSVTITGNRISGGRRGIELVNSTGTTLIGSTGLSAEGDSLANTISNAYEYGIGLANASGVTIAGNTISLRTSTFSSVGIQGNLLSDYVLSGNYVSNVLRGGIILNNCVNGEAVNNRIGNFQASSGSVYGIYGNGLTNLNLYHNSIAVDQGTVGGAFRAGSSAGLRIQNNILAYLGAGSSTALATSRKAIAVLDHNNFFSSGSGFIDISGPITSATTLPFPFQNSVTWNHDPQFGSELRAGNAMLRDLSTVPVLVTTDFEGDLRNPGSVDLGADEHQASSRLVQAVPGTFWVYPNPFTDKLTIRIEAEQEGQAQITITDLLGRPHYSQASVLLPGTNQIPVISKPGLPAGTYLLQVNQGTRISSIRVVKQ